MAESHVPVLTEKPVPPAASPRLSSPEPGTTQDRRRRSLLRGRIAIAMGLLGLVFISVSFAYIAWEQRSHLIERDADDIRSNAFFLADHATRLFEVTDLTLRQTAALVEDESWYTIEPSRRLWEQIRAIKEALPYVEDIWLNDASGRLRLTSAQFPTPESNVADRDAFREQADKDQGLFVGEPIIGRVTGRPTFMVSRRLQYPNGSFRGTVSVTVSLAYFDNYWGRLRLPRNSRVSLFRADGTTIVQYPAPKDGISFVAADWEPLTRALATHPEAGTYSSNSEGIMRTGAYHRVGQLPLYMRVSIPENAYRAPWLAQVRIYGYFALFALLTLLALLALAAQQFSEQVSNATLLESEVTQRTGELRKETAALEVLNRTGATLAAEFDIDRIVRTVVDAGVELTGAQAGAFFFDTAESDGGEADGADAFHARSGGWPEAFDDLAKARREPSFAPALMEGRTVRLSDRAGPGPDEDLPPGEDPDDPAALRSFLAAPIVSRAGTVKGALLFGHPQPGAFTARVERLVQGLAAQAAIALESSRLHQAAQHEIEERKQAQAQQSLLIRELHHRVKNTLATVQAVVGATARSTSSIEDFYEAFVGRIISLANTHSLLTEAVWQTASLREILEKELSPYYDDTGTRILFDGPVVELPSEAAVPIGMAVHELTTNAVKYGALSVPSGHVAVRWTSEAVEPDGLRLKLTWQESGGPPVSPPTRQGFGSRLLHRVLATQLNALVEMDFDRGGLRVSIDAVLKQGGFLNPSV